MTKIGIITTLRAEAGCLTREKLSPALPYDIGNQLSLVLSGMGESKVNAAIESLLVKNVEGLISFGTAGALCGGMKSGDIVVPEKIVNTNGSQQISSTLWRDSIIRHLSGCPATVLQGDLLTTNTVISDTESKKALHEATGAIAVDMESALITAAANSHNLPTVTLRVIVDEANMTIPASVLANTDDFGDAAIVGILIDTLKQPKLIWELIKLAKMFRDAKHSMRWIGSRAGQILLPDQRP